jgi:multidrug resistance efflux pump
MFAEIYRRHDESPTDYTERLERAEAEASRWFNDLAAAQIAIFNGRMATAREFKGVPRWDRVREAAKREFKRTTVDASRVAEMVRADMMTAGEISEATSYAFDEAKVAGVMQQAAE